MTAQASLQAHTAPFTQVSPCWWNTVCLCDCRVLVGFGCLSRRLSTQWDYRSCLKVAQLYLRHSGMCKLLRPDGQAGTFTGLETWPCLRSSERRFWVLQVFGQGTDGALSLFTRISWEAVSCHLSLLIGAKSVAQKKIPICFLFDCWAG